MEVDKKERIKKAFMSSIRPFSRMLPIILGVILLIALVSVLIPKSYFASLFSFNPISDSIMGAILGSIFAGNPITSYILGGEFLDLGVSLIAVTAFLVSWVTVGSIQLPAEIFTLGKKFAIWRNILSFIFSILVAIVTVFILNLLGAI